MNKKKSTSELITFRIRPIARDRELIRQLRKAAEITGTPVSQLLREGGETVVKELAKRYPELTAA